MAQLLRIFLTAMTMVFVACKPGDKTPVTEPEPPVEPQMEVLSESIAFAMSMAPGWNLGNNLDAVSNGVSNETCWGNGRCTQQTMNKVRAAGFRSVRIPVSWIGHIQNTPPM